jgi:large subunit ribosomal protein L7/L12
MAEAKDEKTEVAEEKTETAEAPAEAEKAEVDPSRQGGAEADPSRKGGAEVEVPEKFKSLVESIGNLSALELSELVKVLEGKFGVSASAPMMMAGAAAGAGDAAGGAEEKDSYNLELVEAGGNKIAVIKVVREITGKGLKDAKDMVDAAPTMLKEGVPTKEAEELKAKIEEAGGKANLK